ncbi:MAG: acyloxyacyl hydrolase [Pseudomonadota bacterium]
MKSFTSAVVLCACLGAAPALAHVPTLTSASDASWPDLGAFGNDGALTLDNQNTFLAIAGAAALSYYLSEHVFDDADDTLYFYTRNGVAHGFDIRMHSLSFGVENRLSPWFALGGVGTYQWWEDSGALPSEDSGSGIGISAHARWYVLGEQVISPFVEYGAGVFYGFEKFPHDGTHWTFNLSSQIGIEYQVSDTAVIRFGYGNAHQSNNGLSATNPGFDGNGFSLTYATQWK